jgi:hypothetical protein
MELRNATRRAVNILVIPVDSKRLCSPRSNLNLVKHVWDTYMFSFYKYATLIFPSVEGVLYIKKSQAESYAWLSQAYSLCRLYFEFRYR